LDLSEGLLDRLHRCGVNQYLLVTKRSGKSYYRLSRITRRLVGITIKRQIGLWRADYKAEIQLTTLLRFVFDIVTLIDNLMMMFFRTAAIFLIFAMQSAHAAQLDGEANQTSFVANQTCEGCHPAQYQAWSQSHHAQAMQEATAASVKGDFDNSQFEHFGVESRFFKKDGEFVVNTEGPDGKLRDYVVKYTFGIDPLQQYLIEFPGGRLQSLTIAWDTRSEDEGGQRWFHLYPDEKIAPDDPLHWTGPYQNWNGMCAECHSTNLHKGYDPTSRTYETSWSELNVSCQSCHGPGSAHIAWAEENQEEREYQQDETGLSIRFQSMDAHAEVDVCARCHARRRQVSAEDRFGEPLLDNFSPATLRPELYHVDGQILDEVYVYGSFLQSKMYQAGVRCSDCHDPHTAKLKETGNAVCTQCHQPAGNKRFSGLRATLYDSPKHHFHQRDSAGAQCVNCHMTDRKYMVVDPRRDHSFRIPRPDLSLKLNTPNACNQCHAGQTTTWAAGKIAAWYGSGRRQQQHYGEIFAKALAGDAGAVPGLVGLVSDPQQAAIVRATAVELLQPSNVQLFQTILDAAYDENPIIRAAAIPALMPLPPQQKMQALAPLLNDPTRAVRTEVARVLAGVPAQQFSDEQRAALDKALAEYRTAQLAASDVMPGAHLNLAVLASNRGQPQQAERHYREAIELDAGFLAARVNLANLYNATQRNQEAEQVLREAIALAPAEGELYYSLGLLLAEEQRLNESEKALGQAAELMPQRARVQYNHALALQHLGRLDEAEGALQRAYGVASNDPDIIQALLIFHAQQKHWDEAIVYAKRLTQLYPNAAGPRQTLEQLEAMRKPGVQQ